MTCDTTTSLNPQIFNGNHLRANWDLFQNKLNVFNDQLKCYFCHNAHIIIWRKHKHFIRAALKKLKAFCDLSIFFQGLVFYCLHNMHCTIAMVSVVFIGLWCKWNEMSSNYGI